MLKCTTHTHEEKKCMCYTGLQTSVKAEDETGICERADEMYCTHGVTTGGV